MFFIYFKAKNIKNINIQNHGFIIRINNVPFCKEYSILNINKSNNKFAIIRRVSFTVLLNINFKIINIIKKNIKYLIIWTSSRNWSL